MTNEFVYCPIIKGKANDIKAVAFVSPPVASYIKPLYELPPFKPTDEAETILGKFANRLRKLTGDRRCYVDFPLLRPGARGANGDSALSIAYGQLNMLGIRFDPVYGFDRDESLWSLVIQQSNRSGGLMLRLDSDDLEFPQDTILQIAELAGRGLDLGLLDIMIDHRALTDQVATVAAASLTADFIDMLYRATRVRRVVIAGSSAPKTVTAVERDSCAAIPRQELDLWAQVASERLPLQPIYADYGVIHPDFSDLTMATHINGKIRYTSGGHIHIHRGHSLRQQDKFGQYRVLADNVRRSPYYKGSAYSYGDRYIYECATGHAGTGNPGTWVLVDQNHHVTLTALQFQRLSLLAAQGNSAQALIEQAV